MSHRSKQWFARKSLERLHTEMLDDNRLRRVLGATSLTALGVGAIIGAGIFVMTGRAAALDAGPAIVVSYLVAALGCALAAVAASFRRLSEQHGSVLLRASTALIAAGALVGLTGALLVTFLSQASVFLAMSRDGLLPPLFGTVHATPRTPHLSTMLTGGIICVVAALTPVVQLEEMVNIGTLMAFVIVCAAALILRRQRPDAERPFRCPLIYLVAPLGILVNGTMMLFLPLDTWIRLFVWLGLGLVIYFLYGQRHSVLAKGDASR